MQTDDPLFESGRAQAALKGVMDELDASVAPVVPAWAEMVLRGIKAQPRIAPYYPRVAFGAYLELSKLATGSFTRHTNRAVEVLLTLAKDQLDRSVADLDEPLPDDDAEFGGLIGARPSAGPRFYDDHVERQREALLEGLYERALPLAEAVAAKLPSGIAPPDSNSERASEDPGVPGPYDDVREPWFRRILRRGRDVSS